MNVRINTRVEWYDIESFESMKRIRTMEGGGTHFIRPYATLTSHWSEPIDEGHEEYVSLSKMNEIKALVFTEGNSTVAVTFNVGSRLLSEVDVEGGVGVV